MSRVNRPSALVTGGAGFIGSSLVNLLINEGYRVVIVDSLLWGDRRISSHVANGVVDLLPGDIRDEQVMQDAFRLGPFQTVYHLAALHYIPYCDAHRAETLSVNVLGTQNILGALESHPPERFIFTSTGDVYAPKDGPHTEEDELRPFSIYGISKLFGEILIAATASGLERTRFRIARLFNVFGPGETNPHVIPDILAQVGQGNSIRLGNTWPRRDYIHVHDVARALLLLGRLQAADRCESFNVGTGVASSVDEIMKTLQRVLNRDLKVELNESRIRKVERPHLQASARKIVEATGWTPLYSLETGLRELCEAQTLVVPG